MYNKSHYQLLPPGLKKILGETLIAAKSSVRLRMAVAWGAHRDWASRGLFNAVFPSLALSCGSLNTLTPPAHCESTSFSWTRVCDVVWKARCCRCVYLRPVCENSQREKKGWKLRIWFRKRIALDPSSGSVYIIIIIQTVNK